MQKDINTHENTHENIEEDYIQVTELDNIKKECCLNVNDILNKYSTNLYMTQRVCYYITKKMPHTLELEEKNYEKKIIRNDFLTNEQQMFIQLFLNDNKYYYLYNNNSFYFYDGKSYSKIKEDIIHYQLLTSISKDRKIMEWKYKTKINILKLIRERSLFKSIPESITIQKVLNLLQPIFINKNNIKYFLTIIGDNILKKNNDLVFFIKPKTKKYLVEMEKYIHVSSGILNTINNLVTKFHDSYSFNNCRLVKSNTNISIDIWDDILSKNILDIICVAAHYSQRFKNSDYFINHNVNNEEMKTYVLYLKNNTQENILNQFYEHSIHSINIESNSNSVKENKYNNITWKNMHLIWKLYISNFSFPSIIYSNTLKEQLKEKFEYNESTDTFNNITSKYLPFISNFIDFWEKTIQNSPYISSNIQAELEVDELSMLYKSWRIENNINTTNNTNINESDIIRILHHFFSSIDIIDNKFILNITSNMWNKNEDIKNSILSMKNELYNPDELNENNLPLISFDEAYNYYNNYYNNFNNNNNNNNNNNKYIVSKRYFNNYLCCYLKDYIYHDKFISISLM
jgi:hypothetical protein